MADYDYRKEYRKHLRTTNPVESPFGAVRWGTTMAKHYKRVDNANAMIWKLLMVAEQTFRKVKAPELMASVAAGATYVKEKRGWVQVPKEKVASVCLHTC
ncbi:MAG: hypothetical protein K6U89_19180 [Chloroflexi bacterium]|nr:hypothetical protein [Chloroflexota bacterium]